MNACSKGYLVLISDVSHTVYYITFLHFVKIYLKHESVLQTMPNIVNPLSIDGQSNKAYAVLHNRMEVIHSN